MTDIKTRVQGIEPSAEARDIKGMVYGKTESIYETINVISIRAKQVSVDMKKELVAKLEEFASTTENLEEIHENKEQIEISKFYERLPNPVLIACHEFMDDKLSFRYKDQKGKEGDI